jgi:hypothetical protein
MISNAKIAEHVEAVLKVIPRKEHRTGADDAADLAFVALVTNLLQNINDLATAARTRRTFEVV